MEPSALSCPICRTRRPLTGQVSVCTRCHSELVSHGQINLTSTAEFAALTSEQAARILAADNADSTEVVTVPATSSTAEPPPSQAEVQCSWCGTRASDVKKLLSNQNVHICNQCVALCADIMHAELGDSWR